MNFLFFDSETTGLSEDKHAMVEIALIPIINGVKRDPFVSKIKPHSDAICDPRALEINGLTFNQIQSFPDGKDVIKELIAWLESHKTIFNLAGHNCSFDRKFLKAFFSRHGCMSDYIAHIDPKEICTLEMAKQLKVKSVSNKLGDLCKYFKIELKNAHTALADIEATYELYLNLKAMTQSDLISTDDKLSYQEKRVKYLGIAYSQITPNGININPMALKDPRAIRFLVEEIYRMFGG